MKRLLITLGLACCIALAQANTVLDAISHSLHSAHIQKIAVHQAVQKAKPFKAALPIFNQLREHYSLVVFYLYSCPHCQRFLPVLKSFVSRYGFKVYPYSITGQSLPSFPHSLTATHRVVNAFFSTHHLRVPALFLVNNKNLNTYLVSQSGMSYQHLYSTLLQAQTKLFGV